MYFLTTKQRSRLRSRLFDC